jgi:hypothetical protein
MGALVFSGEKLTSMIKAGQQKLTRLETLSTILDFIA